MSSQTAAQAFERAITLQEQGRLDEAVALYQTVLREYPKNVGTLHNLGVARAQQGRAEEAAELFRAVLALNPRHPEAHNNLGNALRALGREAEAVTSYEQALALRPGNAEAQSNLGSALRALDRHEEALAALHKALALRPLYPEAHYNLGNVLLGLERYDEASASFERAAALKPRYAEAHLNLGKAFLALKRPAEALAQYDTVLALEPDNPEAHNNRGNALQALKRHAEALPSYEKAIALRTGYADAHNNLGNTLHALDRSEEAIVELERALALKPDNGNAKHFIGIALTALGRLDEARRAIEAAIVLTPRRPEFYRSLSNCKHFAAGDPAIAEMEEMALDMASFTPDEQIELHFALGKALADIGRHTDSFDHLLAGGAIKRSQIVYDEAAVLGVFDRLRRVFTPAMMRGKAGQGYPSSVPIFIVGMPRSGTTLIEQILASHPKVFGAGELDAFQAAVTGIAMPDGAPASSPEAMPGLSAEQLRLLGARYLDAVRPMAPEAERITDKMPGNFSFVGLIHLALPHARIIHARRDPVDTCLSGFSQLFTNGLAHTYDLAELGRYYRGYAALMEHWRSVLPDGVMLEVQYEEVVGDFEPQARRIVAHCGLEWDDACLAFHKTKRSVRTASAAQVRQPLYRSSVGRWLPYKDRLKPLLDVLGIEAPDEPA